MICDSPIPKHRHETTVPDANGHVEDFRIHPGTEAADCRTRIRMRIAGEAAVYYVSATVSYETDGAATHDVEIYRRGGDLVDAFETATAATRPEGPHDATQAVHERYIGEATDWYRYALAADTAHE